MWVRHYSAGKWYAIACPEGSRVERGEVGEGGPDCLLVPTPAGPLRIPAEPAALLPIPAESGTFGVTLAGPSEPAAHLAGATCPACGQRDIAWLRLEDDEMALVCEACGASADLSACRMPADGLDADPRPSGPVRAGSRSTRRVPS